MICAVKLIGAGPERAGPRDHRVAGEAFLKPPDIDAVTFGTHRGLRVDRHLTTARLVTTEAGLIELAVPVEIEPDPRAATAPEVEANSWPLWRNPAGHICVRACREVGLHVLTVNTVWPFREGPLARELKVKAEPSAAVDFELQTVKANTLSNP